MSQPDASPDAYYPKVAVVTGAGTGIGRAVARELLAGGWKVALAGRRAEPLDEAAASNRDAITVPTDITDEASVAALFGAVADAWGVLGLLFNNAGGFGEAARIDGIDATDWRRTVEVNLTGTMLCSKYAFAAMAAQDPSGGRIINNGSVSAHAPRPLSAAYTATKHAVTGLTKSIDLDGRALGIQAGQIDIGNAATDMMAGIGSGAGALQPDGGRRLEPTFDVADAARTVAMMASLPRAATIHELTITATGMPFRARG
ncbi:SDR family oxidoreductase [Spelaeicoccus albus]|uniref:NADP-dependent 3-hydroxy acid dehydrogenase YdfG n=1 Tax=Spelaeicoccus albus TaxID=1280376 RepID=A0A7Z0ABX0_9MICO|nr:SDR family oxidoreductase [Spelaeicoccus albus]NYI67353.1 NADP-dependent 3-hydroxy acid dehydrogenase YdfG [Spelaeicoccus albus]